VAGYALKASYPTVQTLGPGLSQDVVYCTIQTQPSGVIAQIPVVSTTFDQNEANVMLGNFADAIEQVMENTAVISAVGDQQIDPNGTLADTVIFTIGYPAPADASTQITGQAVVPVGYLDFSDAEIGQASLGNVDDILNATYGSLRSAAGG